MTLAERLRSGDEPDRIAAIAALVEQGGADTDEIDALAGCLGHGRKTVERPAAEAFAALARHGVPVEAALDRALASPSSRQRWGAAFALALLGPPPLRTLPTILDTLGVDDGDMRWAAAAIVRRTEPREAVVDALRDLLARGNAAQRKMALYCLRDLDARSTEVERAVVGALRDDAWDVRLAAIASLPRLALDRTAAAACLVGELQRGDERTKRAAAAALGALGERTPTVLDALATASGAVDAALRRAAERSLRDLGA